MILPETYLRTKLDFFLMLDLSLCLPERKVRIGSSKRPMKPLVLVRYRADGYRSQNPRQ